MDQYQDSEEKSDDEFLQINHVLFNSFKKLTCNLLLDLHPICVNRWSHPICLKSINNYYPYNYYTFYLEYDTKITSDTVSDLDDTLRYGSTYGNIIMVKWCLKNGAENKYAILCAAEKGHLEIVKLLLNRGDDIHIWDNYALRQAVNNGHLEVVQLLLEKGADVHANNDCLLEDAAFYNYPEIIKILIEYGAKYAIYEK